MAKMAELDAQRSEPDVEFCELCGDDVITCDMLDECPGRWHRKVEAM